MPAVKEFCFRPAFDADNRPVICVSPGQSKVIGRSSDSDAVVDEPSLSRQHARLSMAPDVPADVRSHIFKVAEGIANGRIKMPESYDGAEFVMPA